MVVHRGRLSYNIGMSRSVIVLCAVCTFLFAGLIGAHPANAQPTTAPSFPDTKEGLSDYIKEMLLAASKQDEQSARKLLIMSQLLVLPDSEKWFSDAFGKELGKELSDKYVIEMKDFPRKLASLFFNLKEPLSLTVTVTKVQLSDDPDAKAYQRLALEAMVNPVALYSVSIRKEGTSANIQMWSIIHDHGLYRMVGHMEGVLQKSTGKNQPATRN